MRVLAFLLIVLSTSLPSIAQEKHQQDPDKMMSGSGELPQGWKVRLDKPDADFKNVKLMQMDEGLHFMTGPAGIYYNPKNSISGSFKAEADFTLNKPSTHPEAYGLFFGGSDLQDENQQYLYFLVRQDGKYLIKQRNGDKTSTIIDWTTHPAVKATGESGNSTNKLAVVVQANQVLFMANNQQVKSLGKDKLPTVDGQVGLRINHNLNVTVSNFLLEKTE
jgi:hypothetical protein